jgi:hypothetical protein
MSSPVSLVSALVNPEDGESSPLLKIIKIGGLHIYTHPVSAGLTDETGDFYSRREGGPFYRWRFEEESGRWCFSRVRPTTSTLRGFSAANWKVVPPALQARLDQHYLD